MTEASCVEWAVIVAVVLRDALAVLRTTNAARGNDVSVDAVRRLRRTLQDICAWTDAEWYVLIEVLSHKRRSCVIKKPILVI